MNGLTVICKLCKTANLATFFSFTQYKYSRKMNSYVMVSNMDRALCSVQLKKIRKNHVEAEEKKMLINSDNFYGSKD